MAVNTPGGAFLREDVVYTALKFYLLITVYKCNWLVLVSNPEKSDRFGGKYSNLFLTKKIF